MLNGRGRLEAFQSGGSRDRDRSHDQGKTVEFLRPVRKRKQNDEDHTRSPSDGGGNLLLTVGRAWGDDRAGMGGHGEASHDRSALRRDGVSADARTTGLPAHAWIQDQRHCAAVSPFPRVCSETSGARNGTTSPMCRNRSPLIREVECSECHRWRTAEVRWTKSD